MKILPVFLLYIFNGSAQNEKSDDLLKYDIISQNALSLSQINFISIESIGFEEFYIAISSNLHRKNKKWLYSLRLQ